jgi:hypothetical protein
MFGPRIFVATISVLTVLGAAVSAQAGSPPVSGLSVTTQDAPSRYGDTTYGWASQSAHKTLQWDQKGHWGLKLDLTEPSGGRSMQLHDVQAGAYFRVTPQLRVGGAVSLGDGEVTTYAPLPETQSPTPQVKLETNFKF